MNLRPPHFKKETITDLLNLTDILKINEDELVFLADLYHFNASTELDMLNNLSKDFTFKTICVTLGERGAMVWHDGIIHTHPGFEVKVADTVGSGDAFLATFIKGILEKEPLEQLLKRSCATGAFVASRAGANPDYTNADISHYFQL